MIPVLLSLLLWAQPAATALAMHERFAFAALVRDSLVQGNLSRARNYATLYSYDGLFEDTGPAEMNRLNAVAEADSISEAAQILGEVAVLCGSCHAASDVHDGKPEDYPPMGSNLLARMGRHVWAAERLWDGLVWKSDASWLAGSAALGLDPFLTPAVELRGLEGRLSVVQKLAAEARGQTGWPDRADVYARFLGSCAECHRVYESR
ncbi:MAG: hypothetical protein R3200_06385 [Xanthomonadales bacterium]|nr:hypothetical protein [Xanthomonadales bacterium]